MPTPPSERVSTGTLLLYGAPSFAGAAMLVPILIHMPKFYSDIVLVPLGYLAIAIAVARAVDALSDPVFGWLSDRGGTRFGRRRPYIALFAPACALAFWALFAPPSALSRGPAALWFGAMYVTYSIFHTAYGLPYWALGPELTLDYHERSRLFGVREGLSILGTISASVAPGLLMGRGGFDERAAFGLVGVFYASLLVLFCWLLVWRVRERPDFVRRESNPFAPGVRRALRNRPFRILLLTYVVGSIAGAIPGTLMPYFNDYVLRPSDPARSLAILLGTYFSAGFVCLPLWVKAARRFGKRPAWLASSLVGVTGQGATFFLGEGDMLAGILLIAWAGSSFGAGLFLGPAMQADVIDYDELHTGKRREAQYSAFWGMLPKFVAIPSAAVPIAILGSIGYVPNAVQSPEVTFAIRAIFSLTPALFSTLSFFIAWRFPIDERVHRAILDGCARHREGLPARDPLTGVLIPAVSARSVDEDTSWFLDHFSRRELRRFVEAGPATLVRSVWRAVGLAVAVAVAAAWFAMTRVTNFEVDPGALPVLAIVTVGLATATCGFHLSRLRPAHRLAAGAVPTSTVRAYLAGS